LIHKITSTETHISIPNYAGGGGDGIDDFYGIVLHHTIRDNDKMFVTPKLLHEYVSSAILFERLYTSTVSATIDVTDTLEVHNGDDNAKITTDRIYIYQQMHFFTDDANRKELAEAQKKYMTIEDTGLVVFKQIEYLSGHTSNIIREADEYSMVTGLMTQTSYDNQFVCGMYNHSNTVYVRNGYKNPSETNSVFVVGTGTNDNSPDNLPDPDDTANGLEVHTNGEVYVRSNLILGKNWRLSFTEEELRIEKFDDLTKDYIQKHVFN